jgi:hypothetical protein
LVDKCKNRQSQGTQNSLKWPKICVLGVLSGQPAAWKAVEFIGNLTFPFDGVDFGFYVLGLMTRF